MPNYEQAIEDLKADLVKKSSETKEVNTTGKTFE